MCVWLLGAYGGSGRLGRFGCELKVALMTGPVSKSRFEV